MVVATDMTLGPCLVSASREVGGRFTWHGHFIKKTEREIIFMTLLWFTVTFQMNMEYRPKCLAQTPGI
jgi:hypothetical protein